MHGDSLTQRESWCEWIHATFFIYNKEEEERRREKGRKGENKRSERRRKKKKKKKTIKRKKQKKKTHHTANKLIPCLVSTLIDSHRTDTVDMSTLNVPTRMQCQSDHLHPAPVVCMQKEEEEKKSTEKVNINKYFDDAYRKVNKIFTFYVPCMLLDHSPFHWYHSDEKQIQV